MTGLELLKEEMMKRGCTRVQADSKAVLAALEIISESEGKYTDLAKLEKDIEEKEREKKELEKWINDAKQRLNKLEFAEGAIKDQLNRIIKDRNKETTNYIDKFFRALEECETPAGRDAIKAAQVYVNSVDVDTKYDNTAFIIGLASVLSRGGIAPVEELHKINPKIPSITVECNNYITHKGKEAIVDIVEKEEGERFRKVIAKV